jgi:hypothetical protein
MRHPASLRATLLVPLLAGLSFPAAAEAPSLKVLSDWQAGRWQAGMIGGRTGRPLCLASPETLVAGGRPRPGCSYTILENTESNATITYTCPAGRTGRTTIRRDALNIYTIDAQGIDSNLPFGDRAEWRRIGSC